MPQWKLPGRGCGQRAGRAPLRAACRQGSLAAPAGLCGTGSGFRGSETKALARAATATAPGSGTEGSRAVPIALPRGRGGGAPGIYSGPGGARGIYSGPGGAEGIYTGLAAAAAARAQREQPRSSPALRRDAG